jgi:hypothetical protein
MDTARVPPITDAYGVTVELDAWLHGRLIVRITTDTGGGAAELTVENVTRLRDDLDAWLRQLTRERVTA